MAKRKAKQNRALASGYDAVSSTGKRKAASPIIKREDEHLKGRERNVMTGGAQALYRNFSMVAWAVRKHLDYNTHFDFQVRTETPEFNDQLESLMAQWMRPANCDASGRLPFHQMIRLAEARRVVDGDFFLLRRSNGTLQAIEGDLVRDPDDAAPSERWYNGGLVNREGRVQQWHVCERERNGTYAPWKRVVAGNMVHICAFDRFDQTRGVSPLTSAYNAFRDVYEGIDYALAKMKVEQLFALVIKSTSASGTGEYTRNGDGTYDVDFGRGPIKMELDGDDDAEFLSADNPGSNTQEFLSLVLSMAIKSLDLPINFVDESRTNFFGSRAAWLLYDRSCLAKRAVILEALRKITIWKMQQWIVQGQLSLPQGVETLADIDFEWVHRGMPWWDPSKEIQGDLEAMRAGLDNPYRICKERGRGELEENLRQIAKARDLAEELNLNLSFLVPENAPPPVEGEFPPEDDEESDDAIDE